MPIWEEAAKGKRCEGSTPQVDVESRTVDSGRTMCADACARRATYFSFGKCTNRDGKRFCKCNCETKVRDHECIKQVDDKGFDLYEILEVPGICSIYCYINYCYVNANIAPLFNPFPGVSGRTSHS